MQHSFMYGTQYYRYPSPPESDWHKDLTQIAELGFNVVKIWATWGRMHRAPGEVALNDLLKIMDICMDLDLNVVVNTILENAPYWVIHQHPEYFYEASDGRRFQPISRPNTPGGGWPGLCMDNAEARDLAGEFFTVTGKRLSQHPAFWGWDVWNEVFFEPIDYAGFEGQYWCYCPGTQAAFLVWLQEKYSSIENLNEAWRRQYSSWDEVYPPRYPGGYADWWDWIRFRVWRMSDELKWRVQTLRDVDPDHPITSHGIGYSLHGRVTHLHDEWEAAKCVDSWGVSAFPKAGNQDACDHMALLDLTRSVSALRGQRFWHTELQGGQSANGLQRSAPVNPEDTSIWNWNALAAGADGLLYWQYRPERLGPESPGYGLVNQDGTITARATLAGEIARFTISQPDIINAKPVRADVAIVCAHESQEYAWMAAQTVDPYAQDVFGFYRVLWEENIQVDFVLPENLSGYRMAFLPFPLMLQQGTVDALKSYVKAGGLLISSCSPAQFVEHGWASNTVPGLGLDKLFGGSQTQIRWLDKTGQDSVHGLPDIPVGASWYAESYKATGGQAMGHWETGESAALLKNSYGKGRSVLIGTLLGASIVRGDMGAHVFLRNLLEKEGIEPHFPCNRPGVITRLHYTDAGEVFIFCVNTGETCRAAFTLPEKLQILKNCYSLLDDLNIPIRQGRFESEIDGMAGAVFRLS